jgi:PadR family transcriptional regulator PadR
VVKQMTEMLKGTLEGIVLAILSVRPAYGYEITASLREQGFSTSRGHRLRPAGPDRAARLRRRGEDPVREGAAAQGVLLNAQGQEYLEEFWRSWSFLAERIEKLHEGEK